MEQRRVGRLPDSARRPSLKPLGHHSTRLHPIHLGWWFLGILAGGQVVIAVWTVMQIRPGVDVVGTVSIGVSAAATYLVAMLAAVALINVFSWIRQTNYLWILPSDFADIPLDWPILVALGAGLIAGRLYWH
jgi:hypothetical protein